MQAPEANRNHVFKDKAARQRFVGNYHRLAAGRLNCKNHTSVPAVAICNYCGYGTCRECTVVFGLKRYCTEDAEMALRRSRVVEESTERGLAITAASILSVTIGLSAMVVGFLLIIIGLLGPAAEGSSYIANSIQPFTRYFVAVFLFPEGQILLVGFISFMAGSVEIASGYFLWNRSKPWAVVSIITVILGPVFTSSYLEILALAGVITFAVLPIAVIEIGLIGYGWKHLK